MSKLTYHNVKRWDSLPFDKYLALPGISHSTIKNKGIPVTPTDAMRLGSLVDGILTDPSSVRMNDPQYMKARKIAMDIRENFGTLLPSMKAQVSYTGEIRRHVEGGYFSMITKGRIDWLIEGMAIVDLKVSKVKDIRAMMEFFRYDNPLYNYAKLCGVDRAYLSVYSIPRMATDVLSVDLHTGEEFWAEAVAEHGKFVKS